MPYSWVEHEEPAIGLMPIRAHVLTWEGELREYQPTRWYSGRASKAFRDEPPAQVRKIP